MTAERPEGHPQRSLLFLAIFAGWLGSCGAYNATAEYGELPYMAADSSVSAELAEAQQSIRHIIWSNPNRRALAIGGLVVSIMLMIGSLMLFRRQANAAWWLRNSIAARLVWTGLHAVSNYFHIQGSGTEIQELMRSVESTEEWAQSPDAFANSILFGDVIHAAILLYLLWRLAQDSSPREPQRNA